MKLSVVIPAHNEVGSIGETVLGGRSRAAARADRLRDRRGGRCQQRRHRRGRGSSPQHDSGVRCVRCPAGRFGHAVRAGLDVYTGDAVAIVMADLSDSPRTSCATTGCWRRASTARSARGSFVAAGSTTTRVQAGAQPDRQPRHPRALPPRLQRHHERLQGLPARGDRPHPAALSNHFNLTVELPLKAVVRGHSYAIVPISWTNRERGVSKLRLQEMGSRYLFIVLYVFLEHHLSRGDYRRPDCLARTVYIFSPACHQQRSRRPPTPARPS